MRTQAALRFVVEGKAIKGWRLSSERASKQASKRAKALLLSLNVAVHYPTRKVHSFNHAHFEQEGCREKPPFSFNHA